MPDLKSEAPPLTFLFSSRPLECLKSAHVHYRSPGIPAYLGVTHQQLPNYTMAEKQTALVENRDGSSDDEDFTWTEEEEKALVRRLVLHLEIRDNT
jgi:hypothetical protein